MNQAHKNAPVVNLEAFHIDWEEGVNDIAEACGLEEQSNCASRYADELSADPAKIARLLREHADDLED